MVVIVCTFALNGRAQTSFSSGSYDSLLQVSAQEDKLLLVHAYTDWCRWCKLMEKETYRDSSVAVELKKHFIAAAYEMQKSKEGQALARKVPVNQYPTVLVFKASGELIYTIEGFSPPSVFLEELKRIVALKEKG